MLCGLLSGYGSTASRKGISELSDAELIDTSAGVLISDNAADYENHEVFVMYADGSTEVLKFENDSTLSEGIQSLAKREDIILVQPNYTYESTALSTSDEFLSEQWALDNDGSFYMEEQQNEFPVFDDPFGLPSAPWEWVFPQFPSNYFWWFGTNAPAQDVKAQAGIDINAKEGWSLFKGGNRDVTIAMVDTGIDYTHEDLAGRIWTNTDEIAGNGIDDDKNGFIDDVNGWNFYGGNNKVYTGDEDSHGTHGAGTIAANANNGLGIAGIAQSSHIKVMPVKALGGWYGSGSTESIINAIRYAEANGAQICNLSLGTDQDDRALYQAIAGSKMLFVVAAGNDGRDIDSVPSYPAAYALDNIITVANLNYDGNLHYTSSYGKQNVDLAAPGTYILSTTPANTYSYMTGTSMSAPVVSAAAAMVYSHYADISLADVKEILLSSVKPVSTLDGLTLTGGMLDLGAAMKFDLNTLSGTKWSNEASAAPTKGSAPVITTELVTQKGVSYLIIRVNDADNDVLRAAYASGTVSVEQFKGGSVGSPITLDETGKAVYVARPGIFTFYAIDYSGNETVNTIQITNSTEWPGRNIQIGFDWW